MLENYGNMQCGHRPCHSFLLGFEFGYFDSIWFPISINFLVVLVVDSRPMHKSLAVFVSTIRILWGLVEGLGILLLTEIISCMILLKGSWNMI